MFLSKLFRRKKKNQNPNQPIGQATTTVPSAGAAVGAGVGAAQPGEAISQTNPVPTGNVVDVPTSFAPEAPETNQPSAEVVVEPTPMPAPGEDSVISPDLSQEPAVAPEDPVAPDTTPVVEPPAEPSTVPEDSANPTA